MKHLFSLPLLVFALTTSFMPGLLHAAVINLSVGESVTLQPSSTTTVNCGGENAICTLPVKNLKAKFDYCESSTNNSVGECLGQIWPQFRASFRQCTSQGFDVCLTFCKSSFETLDCLSLCE